MILRGSSAARLATAITSTSARAGKLTNALRRNMILTPCKLHEGNTPYGHGNHYTKQTGVNLPQGRADVKKGPFRSRHNPPASRSRLPKLLEEDKHQKATQCQRHQCGKRGRRTPPRASYAPDVHRQRQQ